MLSDSPAVIHQNYVIPLRGRLPGLENRYARKGIGGSNPSPSANHKAPVPGALWLVQAGVVDEPRFGTEPAGKAGECQRRALSEAVIPPPPPMT